MKQIIYLIILVGFLVSCEKNLNTVFMTENSGIMGKWNIVVDTTYAGVAMNNHAVSYKGTSADYFAFGSDSVLTMHEAGVTRLANYVLTSDSTIDIKSFTEGFDITEHCILLLDSNTAIINSTYLTPGGGIGRIVHLSR